jgi:adenosylcobinamide-GDP ribazoletransferase
MTARELAEERLAELAAAFGLLTRLPVEHLALPAVRRRADAAWAYPLVGAAIGALGGALYWLAHGLACPPALAALWALAVMVLATGAMHEDGLADCADGLGGSTRAARLAIMRDHQIGSYGVIALVLSLALRGTAIALVAEPALVLQVLIAAGAASRSSAVLLMSALPPARTDGLSVAVGRPSAPLASIAIGLAFILSWLLLGFGTALLMVLIVIAVAMMLGSWARARLGGQTGDVLGAVIQLCEGFALTALAILVT